MKRLFILFCLLFWLVQLQAQVLVSKEPRHRVVFVNDKARIMNIQLRAGDTTQYHLHEKPSIFLCFSKTTTAGQLIGKEPSFSTSSQGYMWFEDLNPPHSKVHRVWNADTNTFHVMDVELLTKTPGFTQKPITASHLNLEIDTAWVRAYKITLEKYKEITIKQRETSCLVVAINNCSMELKNNGKKKIVNFKPADFFWLRPGSELFLLNFQDAPAMFALFEIK